MEKGREATKQLRKGGREGLINLELSAVNDMSFAAETWRRKGKQREGNGRS
jgi:hypothetical protein